MNGDGSFTENADADQSGNTTISPRKKRKRSKKSKNNLFSLEDIKKDLKEFLKKEVYNEVGMYKTNLPPFSAGLSSSSPLPPAPSFFPVAGSLKPNTNNGAEAVFSLPNVVWMGYYYHFAVAAAASSHFYFRAC